MLARKLNGFTLIELVIVIVVIGILAAIAVPKFTDVSTSAAIAAHDATITNIQSGINIYTAKNKTPPSVLDSIPPVGFTECSALMPCFSEVVDGGVISDENHYWFNVGNIGGSIVYYWRKGNAENPWRYWEYNPNTGSFDLQSSSD